MRLNKLIPAILAILISTSAFASDAFEGWADDLAEELRVKVLQNNYARRLIFPKKDRIPTVAWVKDKNSIVFGNIHDSQQLWSGIFKLDTISKTEIMNIPIAPGAFHFATLFHFSEPVTITSQNGESKKIRGLLMGTGPEKDFSIQGIAGLQLIQMRAYSIEFYESIAPVDPKYRHTLNTSKVDPVLFFLAHAEETARLAAMTYLRALSAESPDAGDQPIFQKYNVFGANCVSSGIQNLARAVKPEYQKHFLSLGKKDIRKMETLTREKFLYWIQSWHQVGLQALGAIVGRSPDRTGFKQLETFHKQLRSTNMMALPWRAKPLIDWATR